MVGLRHAGLLVGLLVWSSASAQPRSEAALVWPESLSVARVDAWIQDVFADRSADRSADRTTGQTAEAAGRYLALLARLDAPVAAPEAPILLRHLRAVAHVLPPSAPIRARLEPALAACDLGRLPAGTGTGLVRWWRRQDPLPGTAANERLEEHLRRLAHVRRHFRWIGETCDFDDRGTRYLRLGPPGRTATVRLSPALSAFDLREVPPIPPIPANEIWVYPHLGDAAYFVFIRSSPRQPFRERPAVELIPAVLRGRSARGEAGRGPARALLAVLEEVYGQLALAHPAFGDVYDAVTTYNALPYPSALRPDRAVRSVLQQAREEDSAAAWRRAQQVPPVYSAAAGPGDPLAVPMRWARFLEADGTTRTEVYWGVEASALQPPDGALQEDPDPSAVPGSLLTMSVARYDDGYRLQALQHRHYLTPADAGDGAATRTFVVRGDTGRYHLGVQWEQRRVLRAGEAGPLEPGARLKLGTARIDSLVALDPTGRRLEMSDLRPMIAGEAAPPADTTAAYPFATLPRHGNLAFYFELYHLAYDADGRTRYTIAYRILRPDAPDGRAPTSARTRYRSDAQRVAETIVLDLTAVDRRRPLTLTVHVVDEVSGAEAVRSISFAAAR